jgi:hypothetical protein
MFTLGLRTYDVCACLHIVCAIFTQCLPEFMQSLRTVQEVFAQSLNSVCILFAHCLLRFVWRVFEENFGYL